MPGRESRRTRVWTTLCAAVWAANDAVPSKVTYSEHVAPVPRRHCATCHRRGEAVPFFLETYQQARIRGRQILHVVDERIMPPWPPAPLPDERRFHGERRLSADEIALLHDWAENRFAEGDPALAPPPLEPSSGWQLGTPDVVATAGGAYTLPAEGPDEYRNFLLPIELDDVRYVRAVEFRLGGQSVVHHATLMMDPTPTSRDMDAEDEAEGFEGMAPTARHPGGRFLGWVPGKYPEPEPEDMSWVLPPAADLVLQLHLLPSGKPVEVQPTVGLYFADDPPRRTPFLVKLACQTMDVAPGVAEYTVEDRFVLPVAVQVLGISPHMHNIGKVAEAWVEHRDGTRVTLVDIPDWNFQWQDDYTFEQPVMAPAGSALCMRFVFDNSAENPRNPSSPPRRIVFGPNSSDEMADCWIQVLAEGPPAHEVLRREHQIHDVGTQIARVRRDLAAAPDDAGLHADLSWLLTLAGQTTEALTEAERALALDPDSIAARNNCAVLRARGGDLVGARELLESAVADQPDHFDSWCNLARIVRSLDLERCRHAYERALALREDLETRAEYGVLLKDLGENSMAEESLLRCVRMDPSHFKSVRTLADLAIAREDWPLAKERLLAARRVRPQDARLALETADVLARLGDERGVVEILRVTLPNLATPEAALDYAWILATSADDSLRDGKEALEWARRTKQQARGPLQLRALETMAAALAELGRFPRAVSAQEEALALARTLDAGSDVTALEERLQLYRAREPFRSGK